MTQDKWCQLKQQLLTSVGHNHYASWIEPLVLSSIDSGEAVFKVPTAFLGSYVNQNFSDQIIRHFNEAGERVRSLRFETVENRRFQKTKKMPRKKLVNQITRRTMLIHRLHKMTY